MSNIDLGKQIGPLPLGAWVVVVGTGVGIAVYNRRNGAASGPPEVVEDNSIPSGVGVGGTPATGWQDTSGQVTSPTAPVPATNEEWGRAAVNELIAQGYNSAEADAAVRIYLAAGALSVQQYALMRIALNKLGSPPVPLPPGPAAPTPTPTPVPVPTPAVRYHMVWMSEKLGGPTTIRARQSSIARDAAARGIWRPSTASLNSVISQAATRSAVRPDTKLPAGRWVVTFRPQAY